MIITIIILLFFFPYLSQSNADSTYRKTWNQSNGSKLKITVSSNTANLLVDTLYTYKVALEAIAFGSNIEGFFSIAVGLRFVSFDKTIKSDLKCNIGDLTTVGSKIHILIQLSVPAANEFSLGRGESLQGQLQYIVFYSEQSKDWNKHEMGPNYWAHQTDQSIGWETISQGKITNPFINNLEVIIIALITVSLISSVIVFYTIIKKRAKK
ncbi:MAG: hypothetical protein JSU57_05990 [Candidatus Heimdallarchaeota archaeon]|nr:MAG: hypothetical protein JSU57_05990 [Candidatus Heimdallarchaeota archaeon]